MASKLTAHIATVLQRIGGTFYKTTNVPSQA